MTANFLQVALGGALGATARYGATLALGRWFPGLPVGTLVVNVLGSFTMGLLAAIFALRGGHHLAPLLMTGVLGGFTTFSAFSLDTLSLWERGESGWAMGYVAASVGLSLVAVVAGLSFGRTVLT